MEHPVMSQKIVQTTTGTRQAVSKKPARLAAWATVVAMAAALLSGCPQQGAQGPQGEQGIQGPAGTQGIQGPAGPQGEDGQLRIYGDGTTGDVTVSANADLTDLDPNGNLQFNNLTINTGVTLTVSQGGIIRCSGSFINNGTLQAGRGGAGGVGSGSTGTGLTANADPGISRRAAVAGAMGSDTAPVYGGNGGLGVTESEAMMILDVQPGGGGGGCSLLDNGADGGGGVLVLAKTSIVNAGTILADGYDAVYAGAGGGGGGIVILASPGSVANTGLISAAGGKGIGSTSDRGAGGGGGGGIVHFMSPVLDTSSGTVDVGGGPGGTGGTASYSFRAGGGGGGASGGDGGWGGAVYNAPANTAVDGGDGYAGYTIESLTDPTAWFD